MSTQKAQKSQKSQKPKIIVKTNLHNTFVPESSKVSATSFGCSNCGQKMRIVRPKDVAAYLKCDSCGKESQVCFVFPWDG
jgi:predicted RNA-binding Zn-ribbon protein involved in translation (DUF1610 family)